jgi:hypothetical protein
VLLQASGSNVFANSGQRARFSANAEARTPGGFHGTPGPSPRASVRFVKLELNHCGPEPEPSAISPQPRSQWHLAWRHPREVDTCDCWPTTGSHWQRRTQIVCSDLSTVTMHPGHDHHDDFGACRSDSPAGQTAVSEMRSSGAISRPCNQTGSCPSPSRRVRSRGTSWQLKEAPENPWIRNRRRRR